MGEDTVTVPGALRALEPAEGRAVSDPVPYPQEMGSAAILPATVSFALFAALFGGALPAQGLGERLRQAEALVAKNDLDAARKMIEGVVADFPKEPRPLELRAWLRNRTGDYDGAVDDATVVIGLDPRSWRAHFERGFALFHKKLLREALAEYDAAARLGPRVASIHGERGDILRELGDHVAAIAAYDRAIKLAPKWPQAWTCRGMARQALCDFPGALVDLRRASELDPDDMGIWRKLAGAAFDCRDDEAARAAGAAWVERVPAQYRAQALDEFGRMLWRIGDRPAAIDKLREGLEGAQGRGAAYLRLSLATVRLGAADFAGAGEDLAAGAAVADDSVKPYFALMQWCVDARTKGLAAAAERLRGTTASMRLKPLEQQFVALCVDGSGDDGTSPAMAGNPFEACPRCFFAGWRAGCDGDEVAAQRLLRRCVATGAREWMQWALAVDIVRSEPGGAALRPGLGARIEFVASDRGDVARVAAVTPGGAADVQGLQVGDEILELAGKPVTREAWSEIDARAREGLDLRLTRRRGDATGVVIVRLGLGE